MNDLAIRVEGVSKLYRLGQVGTGTLSHDLNRLWHQLRGKSDPYAKVGQVNDRSSQTVRDEKSPKQKNTPEYVWALRDINLEVHKGEILGIIGRNGAGKSTLLKLLSRVTAPTEGEIRMQGRVSSLLEVGTGMHPELTGLENIYLNGSILGMKRAEIRRRLDDIVGFSGCAKYLDTPVKRYSSGMQVRLGFAVAAHLDCDILIVDEVLAVGDLEFQKRCLGKMHDAANAGKTVIFVTHQLGMFSTLCSAGALVTQGAIGFTGSVTDTLEKYQKLSQISADSESLVPDDFGGPAWLRKVTIADQDGKEGSGVRTGSGCEIRFELGVSDQCDRDAQIDIGFGIYSATTGNCLNITHRSFYGKHYTADDAGKKLALRIDKLLLDGGTYNVRAIVLVNGVKSHFVDDGPITIDVELADFYGSGSAGWAGDAPLLFECAWTEAG